MNIDKEHVTAVTAN